ncbi:MAG: hypothetical protein ACJ72A_05180 [Nocardioidaceae bacterium]
MDDIEQLRELHDSYVWEVNAAVGEGRLDLVWQLADQYLDEALRLVTDGEPTGCGRPQCAVCQRPRAARAGPRRHTWHFRSRER